MFFTSTVNDEIASSIAIATHGTTVQAIYMNNANYFNKALPTKIVNLEDTSTFVCRAVTGVNAAPITAVLVVDNIKDAWNAPVDVIASDSSFPSFGGTFGTRNSSLQSWCDVILPPRVLRGVISPPPVCLAPRVLRMDPNEMHPPMPAVPEWSQLTAVPSRGRMHEVNKGVQP